MPSDSIRVSARFPVSPERLYRAWLDAREHGLMTGGKAAVDAVIGGKFTAWDDYITGMLLQLDPGRRIVQTWRTTEFPDAAPDSRLEILFEAEGNGTRITLIHSDIPEGDGEKYEDGWIDYYFEPMQRWFKRVAEEETPAAAPAAAPKAAEPGPKPAAKPVKKAAPKKAKAKAKAKPARKKAAKKAAKKAKPKARPKKKAAAKRKPAKAKARKKATRRPARKAARKAAKKRPARRPARTAARKAARKGGGRKKK